MFKKLSASLKRKKEIVAASSLSSFFNRKVRDVSTQEGQWSDFYLLINSLDSREIFPKVIIKIIAQYSIHEQFFLPTDYTEAFKILQEAVKEGEHSWAQGKIAEFYQRGYGNTPKDSSLAFFYAKLSADQKDSEGYAALGFCYQCGFGIETNLSEAVRLYKLSTEGQNGRGLHQFGYCLMFGEGIEKNWTEGIRVTRLAADAGSATAQYNLGSYYLSGKQGIPQDDQQAFKWFSLSAKQNCPDGQYSVGYCYLMGRGVSTNEKKALKYYELAAAQNCPYAQYNLGLIYETVGKHKNLKLAVKYYENSKYGNYQEKIDYLKINFPEEVQ